jgi:hypothetical protein
MKELKDQQIEFMVLYYLVASTIFFVYCCVRTTVSTSTITVRQS